MNNIIKLFVGVGDYKLLSPQKEIEGLLNKNKINYSTEVWNNDNCTPPVKWIIIHATNHLNFFFANDKLFKIYIIDDSSKWILENGIRIGMSMEKAKILDSSLEYDDWNEDWNSKAGYWIEDDINDNTVMSISIFIKEVLDEDEFDKYEW
ncbi:hypothetical protein [Lactobacillus corticis]|uniref:Uncharacterized protein n=1 Tax=Lactobacillus corticis TaxID=2201249 RepID=A0A916QJE3_9LACO|nr:hypothetical protein [Lactobacillus corticis]GFZ27382.1 hypothetical protein LCB40_12620 [Lactobacillus corticis]